jgi:ketosteroid isomerase-like protein
MLRRTSSILRRTEPSACLRTTVRVSVARAAGLALALAASASAQGGGPSSGSRSPQTPEADIRAVLEAQVAAWNRGDVAAFMHGYWNSPETEFVGSNGIMRGWRSVLDRYRKTYPTRAAMGHLDFSDLEIEMLGPDAALAVGRWRLQRPSDSPGGVFTLVFRKFPEGWRIIHDHTSQAAARTGTQGSER